MRTYRVMHRAILGLVLAIGGAQAASAQDYRGTWQQQQACTPDVWRLCGSQIPDVTRIVACLQRNMPSLSEGCRAVFESDSVAQREGTLPPRARGVPGQQPGRVMPPPPPPGYYYDDE